MNKLYGNTVSQTAMENMIALTAVADTVTGLNVANIMEGIKGSADLMHSLKEGEVPTMGQAAKVM